MIEMGELLQCPIISQTKLVTAAAFPLVRFVRQPFHVICPELYLRLYERVISHVKAFAFFKVFNCFFLKKEHIFFPKSK